MLAENYDIPLPTFPGDAEPMMQPGMTADPDMIPLDFNPMDQQMPMQQGDGMEFPDEVYQAVDMLPSQINSQEEWDALPVWAKDLYRAQASGVQPSMADAAKFALRAIEEERRMNQQPKVVEFEGQKFIQHPSGALSPLRAEPSARTERFVDENGMVRLLDKETGVARVVTDEEGNALKAQERTSFAMQGMEEFNTKQTQQQMVKLVGELQGLQQRIAKDGPDAKVGIFGGKTLGQRLAEVQTELSFLEGGGQGGGAMPAGSPQPMPTPGAMPAPTPMPTATPGQAPQPNPMPTPAAATQFQSPDAVKAAFQAGQISQNDAVQILRNQFGMQ